MLYFKLLFMVPNFFLQILFLLLGHNGPVHSIHCEKGVLLSCDTSGVVIEKDFWSCVVEGPGKF